MPTPWLSLRTHHPKEVTYRLATFLGHPAFNSQGLPIPEINGKAVVQSLQPLTDLTVGEWGEVIRIDNDPATQAFLETEGFRPGLEVCTLAIGAGGTMLLQVGDNRIHLAGTVASKILINIKSN